VVRSPQSVLPASGEADTSELWFALFACWTNAVVRRRTGKMKMLKKIHWLYPALVATLALVFFVITGTERRSVAQTPSKTPSERQVELDKWIAKKHAEFGHVIVETKRLDDGTVVDWVARETVEGANVTPPPPPKRPPPIPGVVNRPLTKLAGPPGALPFIRPAYPQYVSGEIEAHSVDDFVRIIQDERNKRGGPPSGNPTAGSNNRLYAGHNQGVTNYGSVSVVNGDFTNIESPTSPEFAIFEHASYCVDGSGQVTDLVGAVVGRNPQVYGSGYRLQAEWFSGGSSQWVTGASGNPWHQWGVNYAPGYSINSPSTSGNTSFQSEQLVDIALHPSNPNAWWIYFNDDWVGYFDTSEAFTVLDNSACRAAWYGEVYDPYHTSPPADWTNADLGSGTLPTGSTFSANWGYRGYARSPGYFTSIGEGSSVVPSSVTPSGGIDTSCYNHLLTSDGGAPFNPTMWFGGPGGNGTGCN
jgi:hypothetical protein